jgi:LuxR family maltose regulon positive regulatory protein
MVLDTLLTTKFYIPAPSINLVSRDRLLRRLDEGMRQGSRLTLISAPAGYGKTTLLGEWIHQYNLTTVWLSLDEGDNDPARFLAYLISALRGIKPGIGETALTELQSSLSKIPATLLTSLVNEMADIQGDFLIVFDDYHTIHNQVIDNVMSFLLEHSPPQAHIAITTRADPLLPVSRLRGQGLVSELRQSDLCFTEEETAEFLQLISGFELSPEDISALTFRTEGWAAGLQMAVASMRAQSNISAFIHEFTGSNRYILDYLIEEVLQSQPESIQGFLLHTSILDQLCGTLCDAVIGDSIELPSSSQTILEDLEHKNLFIIPLDNQREWYRYHRLFADLLKQSLHRSHPEGVNPLHRRASEWYEDNGLLEDAIEHALSCGDSLRSADLIEKEAEITLMRSQVSTFLGWLEKLPAEEIHKRPTLSVYHSWALMWSGAPLETIEAHLELTSKQEKGSPQVLPLQAFLAISNGKVTLAVELAHQAIEQLPEEDKFLRSLAYFVLASSSMAEGVTDEGLKALEETAKFGQRAGNVMVAALVLCELGELQQKRGRLHQAKTLYQQALELATGEQDQRLPVAGRALIGLGDIARERNELDTAERLLSEGITLAEQWSVMGTFEGYMSLVMLKDSQGDTQNADELFSNLREVAILFDASEVDDYVVDMYAARRNIDQGDFEAARYWAEHRDLAGRLSPDETSEVTDILVSRLQKYENTIVARLMVAEERYEEAITLLDLVLPEAEEADRVILTIEAETLRAIALQSLSRRDESVDAFTHALELAEPEGFMRIFLDHGEAVNRLLQTTREEIEDPTIKAYTERLLRAYSSDVDKKAPLPSLQKREITEPLSDREREVLRLLPSSLSSTEMAEELAISVNTLRTHLKNIYGKLGVHSRYEAIARASELGLI